MHSVARNMLLLLVAVLVAFGIVMLYSTSYAAFGQKILVKQISWILLAGVGALVLRKIDYHVLCRHSWIWLLLVGAPLGYLGLAHCLGGYQFPFTGGVKGAFRWMIFGPIRLQPSEFAKIAIILFLASYYARKEDVVLDGKRGVVYPMIPVGIVMVLVLLGGSLSVTVITGSMVFFMAFIAGVRLRYLTPVVLAVAVAVIAAVLITRPETARPPLRSAPAAARVTGAQPPHSEIDRRLDRIRAWRYPDDYQRSRGYQLWHSFLALGSGGWGGLGFTHSRMKQRYLPEAHTDFIVSIVGEELGFLVILALVLAYLLLALSILWLAGLAADPEGRLICSGVGLSLGLHAFVNLGVVSGVLPTTGVTIPFLSYGGSSIVASGIGIGLVLSVSRISEQIWLAKEQAERAAGPRVPLPVPHLFQ